MAFPVVASSTTGSWASATSVNITAPSGISAGDLIIIFPSLGSSSLDITGTGFTYAVSSSFVFKWADGSEGADFAFNMLGGASSDGQWIAMRITGAAGFVEGESDDPATALTAYYGAKDTLWVMLGTAFSSTTGIDFTAAPTNYTDMLEAPGDVGSGGFFFKIATATRNNNTATETPVDNFTHNGNFGGVASLIAIRPTEANGITSISQQASANSAATTITWPAVAAGDFAVMMDFAIGAPAFVTPTGFQSVNQEVNGSNRFCLSTKLCVGTESGSLTGMAGATENDKLLVTFRGNIAATSAFVGKYQGASDPSAPFLTGVDVDGGKKPLVFIGIYGSNAAVSPRNLFDGAGVDVKDGEVTGTGTDLYLAWEIISANLNDSRNVSMDDEGTINYLAQFFFELAAAVPATPSFPPYRANATMRAALRR